MKNKHIRTLALAVKTGVGIFLVSGLSGCTPKKCVKGNVIYTGNKIQECLDKGGQLISESYGSSGSTFVPLTSSNNASKTSGYFSSTSSSSS